MPLYGEILQPTNGGGDNDWALIRSRDAAIPSPIEIESFIDFESGGKTKVTTSIDHRLANGNTVKIITTNTNNNAFNGTYTDGVADVVRQHSSAANGYASIYTFTIARGGGHTACGTGGVRMIGPPAASISDTALFPVDTAGNANQSETTYITAPILAAYLDDKITAMPYLVSTGALDGGSITSGFGSINNGASTITTTGAIAGGSFTIGGHSIDDIDIGSEFTDADDHLMSAGAIKEKILAYNYLPSEGHTANRAVVTTGGGGIGVLDVTATEVGYLDGVTSAIQTQLDARTAYGIANGNTLKVVEEVTAVSGEFARFVDGGIAGVTVEGVKSTLGISDSNTYAIAIALG